MELSDGENTAKDHDCRAVICETKGYCKTLVWVREMSKESKYEHTCYCEAEVINSHTRVILWCYKHQGYFTQTQSEHKRIDHMGCSIKTKRTTEGFIRDARRIHGYRYIYKDVRYEGTKEKVKIICRIHGPFEQRADLHAPGGHGCLDCANESFIVPFENFVDRAHKAHDGKYKYRKDLYFGMSRKTRITCPVHGDFVQGCSNHILGRGCPACSWGGYSDDAIRWLQLREVQIGHPVRHIKNGGEFAIPGTSYKADGFVQHINLILEYHGDYWHGNPKKYPRDAINSITKLTFGELYQRTLRKRRDIIRAGFKYECIWESNWKRFVRFVVLSQRRFRKHRAMKSRN